MKKPLPQSTRLGAALLAVLCLSVSLAYAQARVERHEVRREHFSTPHWTYDNRFHHDHYYPQIGYSVSALPTGRVSVAFRGSPYFFHSGVWYRRSGPSFVVIRPPVGIIVPLLPPSYSTVLAGGVPYYYANDVFYEQTDGGYSVVAPPAGYVEQDTPAAPPSTQAGAVSPQTGSATWYYCESSKTYYPYVSECKEGWREVPATPPHG
jgi:hypothetical protein